MEYSNSRRRKPQLQTLTMMYLKNQNVARKKQVSNYFCDDSTFVKAKLKTVKLNNTLLRNTCIYGKAIR
jgi:hypothetical protein